LTASHTLSCAILWVFLPIFRKSLDKALRIRDILGKFSLFVQFSIDLFHSSKARKPVKKRLLQLSVSAWLAMMGSPALSIEAGQLAPDFELAGPKGPLQLSDYKGKTVYLDFWASWCGPCKQSFPWMNDMQSRYGAKGLRGSRHQSRSKDR
jgi:thiol:disulfide interchange protein